MNFGGVDLPDWPNCKNELCCASSKQTCRKDRICHICQSFKLPIQRLLLNYKYICWNHSDTYCRKIQQWSWSLRSKCILSKIVFPQKLCRLQGNLIWLGQSILPNELDTHVAIGIQWLAYLRNWLNFARKNNYTSPNERCNSLNYIWFEEELGYQSKQHIRQDVKNLLNFVLQSTFLNHPIEKKGDTSRNLINLKS